MRVIVMGQQAFGKEALEKILGAGKDEVVAVYTAPDKDGRPLDPIKQAALDHNLPLYQPGNFKDQDVLDEMRGLSRAAALDGPPVARRVGVDELEARRGVAKVPREIEPSRPRLFENARHDRIVDIGRDAV